MGTPPSKRFCVNRVGERARYYRLIDAYERYVILSTLRNVGGYTSRMIEMLELRYDSLGSIVGRLDREAEAAGLPLLSDEIRAIQLEFGRTPARRPKKEENTKDGAPPGNAPENGDLILDRDRD
jgi:hypothetical protein